MKADNIREIKAKIKPVFHLHIGKLLLKGGFLYSVENGSHKQLSVDFEPGFPYHVYCCFTTEKHLSGSQEMRTLSFEKWV